MGYHRAGFEVIGVDINPQPHYPFEFHQGDALRTLRCLIEGDGPIWLHEAGFDAIHASPPCQGYLHLTRLNEALGRTHAHTQAIAETRSLLISSGRPWVIENVASASREMVDPARICGTHFWMPLQRHRLFESSLAIEGTPCAHHRFTQRRYWTSRRAKDGSRVRSTVVNVYGHGGETHRWPGAMGIDWMTTAELAEAIPPAYTEYIGRQLIDHLQEAAA